MRRWNIMWSAFAALLVLSSLPMSATAQGAASAKGASTPVAGAPAQGGTSLPPSEPDASYVIGVGDTVQIEMPDRPDFKAEPKVDADGNIQLPLVGNLPASNRNALTLRDQIRDALIKGGYFTNPNLTVRVGSAQARYVTVLGAVGQSGLIPLDRTYHLSEILARVGGVRQDGADYVIIRPANNGPQKRFSVQAMATGADLSQDPVVSPGDTIFAPTAELFYVSGQVKSPGSQSFIPGMTMRQAIGRAGGVTDIGSEKGVKINRDGKTIQPGLDAKIQAGDVIIIGERLF
jgi:polysaccharide export outer membrane protein